MRRDRRTFSYDLGPRRDSLTALEEAALAERIAAGDKKAEAELIERNLPLVAKIAQKFLGQGVDPDDLIGDGTRGLVLAARAYRPDKGARFATHAGPWVSQYIALSLRRASLAKIGQGAWRLVRRARRCGRELTQQLGRTPTFEEIVGSLGISEAQRQTLRLAMQALRPTVLERGEDDRVDEPIDPSSLTDPEESSLPYIDLEHAQLTPAQLRVMRMRYRDGMSRTKIATALKLTRQRISETERRALARIRETLGVQPAGAISA
jgi:RNA polymerase primary sigma factor